VIFLLLFSYVILCDLFPLYDFPTDVCAPAKAALERGDYITDDNANKPVINRTLIGDTSNTKKSVSYGFERHKRPATTELILVSWVFTLLCEEIRQVICSNT